MVIRTTCHASLSNATAKHSSASQCCTILQKGPYCTNMYRLTAGIGAFFVSTALAQRQDGQFWFDPIIKPPLPFNLTHDLGLAIQSRTLPEHARPTKVCPPVPTASTLQRRLRYLRIGPSPTMPRSALVHSAPNSLIISDTMLLNSGRTSSSSLGE